MTGTIVGLSNKFRVGLSRESLRIRLLDLSLHHYLVSGNIKMTGIMYIIHSDYYTKNPKERYYIRVI